MKTYHDLIEKLNKGEVFSFSRFGDGEWCGAYDLKHTPTILRKHKQSGIDFARRYLRPIIENPQPYYRGVQPLSLREYPEIVKYSEGFINADILHNMSTQVGIEPFLNALKDKKVLLVAPKYLIKMGWDMILVPNDNTPWLKYEEIKDELDKCIELFDVVLYSCTFMAKVLIHDFHDRGVTQIDTGSLLDPYVGVISRRYHKEVIDKFGKRDST